MDIPSAFCLCCAVFGRFSYFCLPFILLAKRWRIFSVPSLCLENSYLSRSRLVFVCIFLSLLFSFDLLAMVVARA